MTAIHVEVTADDIAACPRVPDVGDGWRIDREDHLDPVELAIARVTGQYTACDEDTGADLATIGARGPAARNTLIVSLPSEQFVWIERFYRGEAVEPFSFDIELDDWIVALFARSTTLLEEAEALVRHESAEAAS